MKRLSSFHCARELTIVASLVFVVAQAVAQTDPLPSWNDGAAKRAIVEFVEATTTQGSPHFGSPLNGSRPSIRTARCGSSTRCIRR
jgi:hypothetical protein